MLIVDSKAAFLVAEAQNFVDGILLVAESLRLGPDNTLFGVFLLKFLTNCSTNSTIISVA